MSDSAEGHERLLSDLQERAKELNCFYNVEEQLNRADVALDDVLQGVVAAIPPGFQHANACQVQLVYEGRVYSSAEFDPTPFLLSADLLAQEEVVGRLSVYYTEDLPPEDIGPFLTEEKRLVDTLADRLGHFLFYQRLKELQQNWDEARRQATESTAAWQAPIRLLRESDKGMYLRIARKMLNHLCRLGVGAAREILSGPADGNLSPEVNAPGRRCLPDDTILLSDRPFELASEHLSGHEILSRVQKWMVEDKASSFMRVLNSMRSSVPELVDALRRFHHVIADGVDLPESTLKSLRVSLTQRLLTEQLDFVRSAKEFVEISDFVSLVDRIIPPPESHGKLGGKAAGLLLAHRILAKTQSEERPVGEVKMPRTWYLASDGLLDFISFNDLQDVIEQKFKEIDQVRDEYPSIIRLFKSSSFTPRVVNGLSVALDDLGEVPLIVRSSSLLEDRLGTAFSGKYKSLFLANQGTKDKRLAALMDAIAEVYASTFGPDPIEYRRDHGLLEFNEEMGILIQEVVGRRVGHYFLPAFAGVAFSNNEFRWSPRIKREDGLIRLVPGLGTRAVDRVADDYPVLVVPGQPNLRANAALDEVIRYSPKKVDVIDLEKQTWETISLDALLQTHGNEYPALEDVFSVNRDGMLQKPVGLLLDLEQDDLIATFQGLVVNTPFVDHLRNMLHLLAEHLETPVDLEFAHDGRNFYLLQCRPQSFAEDAAPAPIPKDVPEEEILFSANRYVSNGWVPDVTHIVYVDPERYSQLSERSELLAVGRAVGRLNKLLPKRQFILMGPGRWGSRGDLQLGVSVTYADISNTSMLIEIARRKGGYVPDLSFGTHFFQDLVESRIRYLPLYPDDPDNHYQGQFFARSPNLLAEMLPEYAHLSDTVRVIDVPASAEGRIVRILQNADLDEAVAILAAPGEGSREVSGTPSGTPRTPVQYWQWRLRMAERIAAGLDAERYGVVALYVFGSTKNATAGPGSDIDLLVHIRGSKEQRQELQSWFEGWSLCLAEMNYLRTGYRTPGLLDVHLISDQDIAQQTSFAAKIGAITDAARELPMGRRTDATGPCS